MEPERHDSATEVEDATGAAAERLAELFPSCATDCVDGCRYGCIGWLHRFGPEEPAAGVSPEAPER